MKNMKFITVISTLLAAFGSLYLTVSSCRHEAVSEEEIAPEGIIPNSIDEVVDVIEVKYGEVKEWEYGGQIYKFSVKEIEDNLVDCSSAYIFNIEGIRLHLSINVETNKGVSCLKVSTRPCGGYFYKNDGSDIQSVWDVLESYNSAVWEGFFKQIFERDFGKGAAFGDSPLSIFIAKIYPRIYDKELNYNVDNSMYKFILIITDSKQQ